MADLSAIFKAYDIRGRTEGALDLDAAYRIGGAFASWTGVGKAAVGRDCRLSSPGLASAFSDGARGQGTDVIDLGEIPTDVAYYYSGWADLPAAMVTASHNPPEWNGIKLSRAGAAPIGWDTGLQEIRDMANVGLEEVGEGTLTHFHPIPGYVEHLLGIVDPELIEPLHVVADGGNGMAGTTLPDVFARIPARITGLYLDPDGTFPNHPADPLQPANLRDLLQRMEEVGPDLGVAFDGDADRAFFVDDQGRPLSGSTTTALIAAWFLEREAGARVVHNLITSRAVPETIRAKGGEPIRTRVGHSFIKEVMADTEAVFGGEHSGHYYFRDNFRADSGMLALLVLLQVISEAGQPVSELRTQFEPYAQSPEINLTVADQQKTLKAVEEAVPGGDVDHLDGLTVTWENRWFNLRPSNTEPVLRLNVEAPTPAAVEELVGTIKDLVEES
ncbi:MAG: phosphomannomutase/phosphoglucomutase [Acidimicrobiia bacterium]